MKTGQNNVLLPTLFNVVNNIVRYVGSKTLFNAVFIRPEQVVHFLLCTYLVNIYFVNCYNCMCSVFTSTRFGSRDDNIANAKATITICHNQPFKICSQLCQQFSCNAIRGKGCQ